MRGIYHGEGHSMAWFTDPAGNSLAVVQLSHDAIVHTPQSTIRAGV
jgi:hypothetical protein